MALLVTCSVGLSVLNLAMMALKPLASPPVVHHETTSIGVTPAAVLGATLAAPVLGADVAELEQAEATRATTEITARIRRDGSFTGTSSRGRTRRWHHATESDDATGLVGGSGRRLGRTLLPRAPGAAPGDRHTHPILAFTHLLQCDPPRLPGAGRSGRDHLRMIRREPPGFWGMAGAAELFLRTLADADNVVNHTRSRLWRLLGQPR